MRFGFQFLALGFGVAIPGIALQGFKAGETINSLYVPALIALSFFTYIAFRKTQLIEIVARDFDKSSWIQATSLFICSLLLGIVTAALLLLFKSFTY